MRLVGRPKRFQFYYAGLIPDPPWHDLPGVFSIIRFDDGPAAVCAVVAAPFEVMQIARGMDLFDNGITVARIMW